VLRSCATVCRPSLPRRWHRPPRRWHRPLLSGLCSEVILQFAAQVYRQLAAGIRCCTVRFTWTGTSIAWLLGSAPFQNTDLDSAIDCVVARFSSFQENRLGQEPSALRAYIFCRAQTLVGSHKFLKSRETFMSDVSLVSLPLPFKPYL
jgi:hypothetical protein